MEKQIKAEKLKKRADNKMAAQLGQESMGSVHTDKYTDELKALIT